NCMIFASICTPDFCQRGWVMGARSELRGVRSERDQERRGREHWECELFSHYSLLFPHSCSTGMAVYSSTPIARLMFCMACVAAPFSRLSSVDTITTRLPSTDREKPPISAWWRWAMRLTQGASSVTLTNFSFSYA